MSGKQFLVLLLLFVFYLLLGAAVFHFIESDLEIHRLEQERRTEEEIFHILNDNLNTSTIDIIIPKLEEYCGKTFKIDPNRADNYRWHFYNAVFFVITVVSTIGYGNLAPTSCLSRLLMIFYALVGIPMNGILLKSLADYFGHFFLRARDKYKTHRHNGMSLAGSILMYFSLGFFVFIISPSFLFMYFEDDWTFDMAIYYAFVSLTTIGFGDLVAGQEPNKTDLSYTLYKVFLIVWLVFGLGYLFMVLSFITDAMRSKRMAKLSQGIKHTQSKLWNGVVHEMPHLLRRVLNELYLLKVKPVYHGDDDSLCTVNMGDRSSSCPDLFWLDAAYNKTAHPYPVVVGLPSGCRRSSRALAGCRPRALSEVLPSRLLVRRRSETELARIDRRATFADTTAPTDSALDPAELLHEFMNALVNWGGGVGGDDVYNTMHKTPGSALPTGGYQGFPDADILSSEWTPQHVLGARQRAKSLAPFSAATDALAESRYGYGGYGGHGEDDFDDSSTLPADDAGQERDGAPSNAEWTWSGTGASKRVHELIRARQSRRKSEAVTRKQQRQDRRMQELQDFQRLKALEEMRQIAREARQKEKRLRARTMSTGAAETGLTAPRNSVTGLMQRLAIPQRLKDLKDLARRRQSLQPGASEPDDDDQRFQLPEKRRSPSYDPVTAPWPWPPASAEGPEWNTQTAHSAQGLGTGLGGGLDAGQGRRDSIFRRNSATVHPVLENTSLAEFLRVLQAVQRQQQAVQGSAAPTAPATPGKTRKLGTAGLTTTSAYRAQPAPNTIFNVFPGLLDKPEKRRLSLRPVSPVPGATTTSGPSAAAASAPNGRRRMSFWPSFVSGSASSDQAASANDSSNSVFSNGLGLSVSSGYAGRKSSTARRLSTFFGGGMCIDPAPDQDAASPAPAKVTKKRRFSIWPTLGVLGHSGSSADSKNQDAEGPPPPSLSVVEDGHGGDGAAPAHPMVPQIVVTYINDAPAAAPAPPLPPAVPAPAPAPREALRRMALTSNLPTTPAPGPGPVPATPARLRHHRPSLGGVPGPVPVVRVNHPYPTPVPGRRGPSIPSPLSTPMTSFRRRALSESTRTRGQSPSDRSDNDSSEGRHSERL